MSSWIRKKKWNGCRCWRRWPPTPRWKNWLWFIWNLFPALAGLFAPSLINLDLSGNEIGDIGAQAIAESSAVNLHRIWLRADHFGDVGACALAKIMPIRLSGLELYDNDSIGDQGANALATAIKKSTCLKTFSVSECDAWDKQTSHALTKSVALSRAPLSRFHFSFETFDFLSEVLLACFMEHAKAVRSYLFRKPDSETTKKMTSKDWQMDPSSVFHQLKAYKWWRRWYRMSVSLDE